MFIPSIITNRITDHVFSSRYRTLTTPPGTETANNIHHHCCCSIVVFFNGENVGSMSLLIIAFLFKIFIYLVLAEAGLLDPQHVGS